MDKTGFVLAEIEVITTHTLPKSGLPIWPERCLRGLIRQGGFGPERLESTEGGKYFMQSLGIGQDTSVLVARLRQIADKIEAVGDWPEGHQVAEPASGGSE